MARQDLEALPVLVPAATDLTIDEAAEMRGQAEVAATHRQAPG